MGLIELGTKFIDVMLHIEDYLVILAANYGPWAYLMFFTIIFLETGFVLTPLLPGDSLLFALGTLASQNIFNIWILFITLAAASILGDTCNYFIGEIIGSKLIHSKKQLINKRYIDQTKQFFKKHGSKAIILARFVPVVRTFAPFMAGLGKMNYWKFLSYNIVGGIMWSGLFLSLGYFFGQIPIVREHFSIVVIGIILMSFIPLTWLLAKEYYYKIKDRHMNSKKPVSGKNTRKK